MTEYRTTAKTPHGLEEERQWARILSTDKAVEGMALLYIQKLCTAAHEFEPAYRKGALKEQHLDYFRHRLAARASRVLETLKENARDTIPGAADLADLLHRIESARTMAELADLVEAIHAVNHTLCDSLEAICRA